MSRAQRIGRSDCVYIESLERRALLAAVSWVGGSAGNWNVPGNWSGGGVPVAADDVTIGAGSTVTIDSNVGTIRSLTSNGLVVIAAGSLVISNGGLCSGSGSGVWLQGGTLTANTVAAT